MVQGLWQETFLRTVPSHKEDAARSGPYGRQPGAYSRLRDHPVALLPRPAVNELYRGAFGGREGKELRAWIPSDEVTVQT
ncbi:unnamed protein product [Arctogadus glacialis]